jgi:hypothetical protein
MCCTIAKKLMSLSSKNLNFLYLHSFFDSNSCLNARVPRREHYAELNEEHEALTKTQLDLKHNAEFPEWFYKRVSRHS